MKTIKTLLLVLTTTLTVSSGFAGSLKEEFDSVEVIEQKRDLEDLIKKEKLAHAQLFKNGLKKLGYDLADIEVDEVEETLTGLTRNPIVLKGYFKLNDGYICHRYGAIETLIKKICQVELERYEALECKLVGQNKKEVVERETASPARLLNNCRDAWVDGGNRIWPW